MGFASHKRARNHGWFRWALTAGAVVGGAVAVRNLLPTDFLPVPTGPYPIGTTVWSVTDPSRQEIFDDGGHRRTLVVQAWYPALPQPSTPIEPYLRDPQTFWTVLDYAHAPRWLLSYLTKTPTHAVTDAPPAHGLFPVVLFATGNMGYRGSNTVQVEELASRGFVVVTFDQPGTVGTSLLPDGRRIPYAGSKVVKPLVDTSLPEPPDIPTLRGIPYPDGIASYLAADASALLDHLPSAPLELADHVDVSRVGAFGVSLGGITMAQWCATDTRVSACLILDAPMPRDVLDRGLNIPALWLTRPSKDAAAEGWSDVELRRYRRQRELFERSAAPAWYVEAAGLKHCDFTDAPFGSPIWSLFGLTSPGRGIHVHEVMRSVTGDFFAHILQGAPETGVLAHNPWPDVTITYHN